MEFIDNLYQETRAIQEQILNHPFPNRIGDGSLPMASFRHFIEQDYLFLIDYGKILGLAAVKAPDRHKMKAFSALLHETISTEMELHIQFCETLGIKEEVLAETLKDLPTAAYTDFLVRVGYEGSFEEIAAALLPCMATYSEIGSALISSISNDIPVPYKEWISMYSSDEFGELALWMTHLVDELGTSADLSCQSQMVAAYKSSCLHELNFWTMCA